ncbi:peptidylprolyl isomerase [Salinimicrobium gaetbulicola]|uniref:Peptidyl-prolyl cis-trans isomerase n=1 Tax=Salinimicrobium gaetbulicola TaxID=999702 RepID=A0ABW3IBX3_9FLAO
MTRVLLIVCSVLLLTACEDKKSSLEKAPATTTEVTEKNESADTIEKKEVKKEKKKSRPKGPLLVQEELIPYLTEYGKENPEDKIRIITRFGNIEVELFHDTPLHRANFILLVKNDYFDETFFHRVADGFVIQGGNSDNPSTNKKRHYIGDYLIPSEFDAGHKHVRGAFSAAKYAEQNVSKASSPFEFFIVQSETGAHHLNNEHTVFGRVIDGMDVVDEISKVEVDEGEWPLRNIYLDVEIIE